jgi:aryl carrier-like protein
MVFSRGLRSRTGSFYSHCRSISTLACDQADVSRYHIAGISIALSGLPNGRVLSFPPLAWPPSSSGIFAAFKTLTKMGHPVDIIHCAPTLIENMYEYMTETKDFTPLTSLKILQPGGAALSSIIVNGLVNRGVNVKTTYGSTEIGPPMRTIPHTRDNPRCYAFRNLYPDNEKLKMEEVADGVYECVVYKGFELAAELWEGKPDDEPYRTNDLFIQDPPGSGFFVLQGRKDDILIHSNGENTSANPLQLDIQTASKTIKRALALGHSKPCVSLLVEVNDDFDPESESTKDEIWKTVKGVNERYPGHSRIIRSMIHILPRGKSLPVTPKGNVKRKEAQTLYQQDIDRLYSNDDGYSSPASDSNSLPLKEFIRSIFAELADVPSAEVKDFTTLYDLGIDSRLALSLRAALSKRIGPISLGTIFENPTIDKLLAFFQKKCQAVVQESRTQVIEKMISKLSAELTSWPTRLSSKSYSTPATETILLTGASGSLGTALLHFLSASSAVSKIYAMVRGPNNEAKLRNSITSRGLDVEAIMGTGKIEVINYSMQDSLLGLDIETYAMLARDVTIVVQNAWKMDFNQGVEYFEDDCIRSKSHHQS